MFNEKTRSRNRKNKSKNSKPKLTEGMPACHIGFRKKLREKDRLNILNQ